MCPFYVKKAISQIYAFGSKKGRVLQEKLSYTIQAFMYIYNKRCKNRDAEFLIMKTLTS